MNELGNQDPKPRWGISAGHSVFVDAINREMDEYLSFYAELITATKIESSWDSRLQERRAVLLILIASYLECLINLYLSFHLAAEELRKAERAPLEDKWAVLPARYAPNYRLDDETGLLGDLQALIKCRVGLVHMRPQFSIDEKVIHQGNAAELSAISHDSIMRWVALPEKLAGNLKQYDQSWAGQDLGYIGEVWDASHHWPERLSFYLKKAGKGTSSSA